MALRARYVLLVVGVMSGICWMLGGTRSFTPVEPEKLLSRALLQTKRARSYSYHLKTELITAHGRRCLNDLEGERVLPDKVRVRGRIFNTPVEIIKVGDTTYWKDRLMARWLKLEGDRLGKLGAFITELDPLVLFCFQEISKTTLSEKERFRGRKVWVVEFTPQLTNDFLRARFMDFRYRCFISPDKYRIVKTEVRARSKDTNTRLYLELVLDDFDKKYRITSPTETDW